MFLDKAKKTTKKKKNASTNIFFHESALFEFFFAFGLVIDLLDFNKVSVSLITSDENVVSPPQFPLFSVDSSMLFEVSGTFELFRFSLETDLGHVSSIVSSTTTAGMASCST